MKELMGGLLLAGLLGWALLGALPGIFLMGLGILAGSWQLGKELHAEKAAQLWRKRYPPYNY